MVVRGDSLLTSFRWIPKADEVPSADEVERGDGEKGVAAEKAEVEQLL